MASATTPVVIGVGDVVNRSRKVEDALEPRRLIVDAICQAAEDAATQAAIPAKTLLSSIDSIDVVASWTWPYDDLPGLITQDLDIEVSHKYMPQNHGGNQPAKLFDDAAGRISVGKAKVAVVCGGEALASLAACKRAGIMPPPGWTSINQDVNSVFSPTTRALEPSVGAVHQIGSPIQVYPLYENGFRAYRGQTLHDNNKESARLYADFAKIAEKNNLSWNYGQPAKDAEHIGQVSKQNRMICYPYPLLMNAFNSVNIAGACILTSAGYAEELGIPKQRWIYPLGGAGTRDSYDFWQRPNYHSSPSISKSIDTALQVSGVEKRDIDLYDFYSCFPIVPKLACHHLGLPITASARPVTLLGGLTSFGGAGNNYSMHALTEMVRHLRAGFGSTGLVLANGGVLTYQHVVCLSSKPRKSGSYPTRSILPEVLNQGIPDLAMKPEGEATIETYTVEFDRSGKALRGYIIGRLLNGERFLANHGDELTLAQLTSLIQDPIGRTGLVRQDTVNTERNLFYIVDRSRL